MVIIKNNENNEIYLLYIFIICDLLRKFFLINIETLPLALFPLITPDQNVHIRFYFHNLAVSERKAMSKKGNS